MTWLDTLLGEGSGLIPHGVCLAWQPGLVWLEAGADLAITAAYYSIPLALISLVRRRGDLAFPWMFGLFAAFILACGTTHLLGVATLWAPLYWLDGGVKAITAVLSLATAAVLWPLLPHALALPSPASLRSLNDALAHQVAERDQAAALLRQSEARQRAAYARTPAALHTLDLEGRLTAVSDQWLDLLGYGRAEILGQPLVTLCQAGTAAQAWADWNRLLASGSQRDVEHRLVRRDGSVRDVLISATVERDAGGAPAQIAAAVTDITERRATEAALHASEERLRQALKMQAVGQLTGGIAHDFNNMLTVVMANLELLESRVASDERAARLAWHAMAGARRAAALTSQLLSFSRQQRLQPEPLDPPAVVEGMRALLERTLGEQCRLLVPAAPADLGRCLADRNQLESALLNLALNARAAMPVGGELRIDFAQARLSAEALAAAEPGDGDAPEPGDFVLISVADTGHGMTEAVRRRAIEPFFTTRPAGEGTGLGLSQTYGFLRQSGGTLRIDSAPGAGTRIDLILPRVAAASRAAPSPDAPPAGGAAPAGAVALASRRPASVLVVEDEADLRMVVADALRQVGYRVTEAADGEGGLASLVADDGIGLLFTDVVMPGPIDGVELALRARRLRPLLPVLFATGYSEHAVLARWTGPLAVLAKPYTLAQLTTRLASAGLGEAALPSEAL